MAEINALTVYKGEALTIGFTLTNDEIPDISGWTIQFTLKARAADDEAIFTRAGTVTSGADKTFTIALTHADLVDLDPGIYAYDVWRIDAGSEGPLSIGKFTVKQSVLY